MRGFLIAVASLVVQYGLYRVWAQQLWLTCLVTPRNMGSSQTRAGTCVPCIGNGASGPPGKSLPPALLFSSKNIIFFNNWQHDILLHYLPTFTYFFNWRIIALQCYVGFCYTTMGISSYYIYPLPLEPSSPPNQLLNFTLHGRRLTTLTLSFLTGFMALPCTKELSFIYQISPEVASWRVSMFLFSRTMMPCASSSVTYLCAPTWAVPHLSSQRTH